MPRKPTSLEDRFRQAKAELAEHELERRRGVFVDRARVESMFVARAAFLRKQFAAIERRLVSRLGLDLAARDVIREELDRVLWQCYGRGADGEIDGDAGAKRNTRPGELSDADETVRVRAPKPRKRKT